MGGKGEIEIEKGRVLLSSHVATQVSLETDLVTPVGVASVSETSSAQ